MNPISELPAIDVHAHFGPCPRTDIPPLVCRFMAGGPEVVLARARAANIQYTVVSPLRALWPRGQGDAVAGNDEAARAVAEHDGLLQWVVLHPGQPRTREQVRRMLEHPRCVGIKIHPEEHRYPIAEQGRALFELAAELRAVVLTHTGEANSRPADFIPFANDYPEVTLILAHLGHNDEADQSPEPQVRAIQSSRHGNVYVDTSSSRSLLPGLIEWAVAEVGADRLLFGTDTPLYFSPSQRARIDHADLTDDEKRLILRDNARRVLDIPGGEPSCNDKDIDRADS